MCWLVLALNHNSSAMKYIYLLISFAFFIGWSKNLSAQASMGFEDQTTTQNCTTVNCQYDDLGDPSMVHVLQSFNGIPVSSATMGTSLGFTASFRPTRTGASSSGLTDEQFFGYAGDATFMNNVTQSPVEGTQGYIMEDIDGEASLVFDPVLLDGGVAGVFSMQYILSGTFEADGAENDKLQISLEVTNCAAATTVNLVNADGDGGAETDLDDLPDDTWIPLVQDLSAYAGCQVSLVIIADCDASTEEFGFDAISFTAGTALPVEFINIAANQRKDAVLLDWSTATETENRGFSIERSTDGRSFVPIGWVAGKGEAQAQVDYEFEDTDVRAGQEYYYRLRQEDFDGAFAYSSMVKITMAGEAGDDVLGRIFPNPAVAGRSSVELYPTEEGDWTISVMDLNGRMLTENSHTLTAGYNLVPLDLNHQSSGTYLVRIAGKEQTFYRRVIR